MRWHAVTQAATSPISGVMGDKYNRTHIVALGCLLWGVMTALIGLSTSLHQASSPAACTERPVWLLAVYDYFCSGEAATSLNRLSQRLFVPRHWHFVALHLRDNQSLGVFTSCLDYPL